MAAMDLAITPQPTICSPSCATGIEKSVPTAPPHASTGRHGTASAWHYLPMPSTSRRVRSRWSSCSLRKESNTCFRRSLLGLPESEVLIADDYFEKSFYPYSIMKSEALLQVRRQRLPLRGKEWNRSTIDRFDRYQSPMVTTTAEVTFDPIHDPFLVEHLLKQSPFLPGVLGLEAVLEAASLWRPGQEIV